MVPLIQCKAFPKSNNSGWLCKIKLCCRYYFETILRREENLSIKICDIAWYLDYYDPFEQSLSRYNNQTICTAITNDIQNPQVILQNNISKNRIIWLLNFSDITEVEEWFSVCLFFPRKCRDLYSCRNYNFHQE